MVPDGLRFITGLLGMVTFTFDPVIVFFRFALVAKPSGWLLFSYTCCFGGLWLCVCVCVCFNWVLILF